MEYGNVDDLSSVVFKLPPDHSQTKKTLTLAVKPKQPKIKVGCAKWGREEWKNVLYPKGIKAGDFLQYYAQQFHAVELNASYYGLRKSDVTKWKSLVGKDFLFAPKFPSDLTFRKNSNDASKLNLFLETVDLFEENLGPLFVLMTDKFKPEQMDELFQFLSQIPKHYQVFVELRNADWYQPSILNQLIGFLQNHHVGLVILDVAAYRNLVHQCLTIPKVFIRFQGYNLHSSDYARIDEWIGRLDHWFKSGLQELYFFMHESDETYTPAICSYFIKEINKRCGLDIPDPQFLNEDYLLENKKYHK